MPSLLPNVDPEGLLEYSVVYTDRAINHMSGAFQRVMTDIAGTLKRAYRAQTAIIVPGSGTFGMEAVARQFATDRNCLVIRNGWFSYRWTQILDMGRIPAQATVLKARRIHDDRRSPFAPAPLDEVVATIREQRPAVVFAPHVETASGMILPDAYLRAVADAVHGVGGLLVLDCIASGAIWVDMVDNGVDVLISAPQKGWSGSPCCALVMLGEHARTLIDTTTGSSFACDLRKWMQIMETYEKGGHAYHATMPTGPRCGGQLHRRRGPPVGAQVPPRRPTDRRRRAAAMRRTGRFPQLPHRPVRPRQAPQRRTDRAIPRRGAAPDTLSGGRRRR